MKAASSQLQNLTVERNTWTSTSSIDRTATQGKFALTRTCYSLFVAELKCVRSSHELFRAWVNGKPFESGLWDPGVHPHLCDTRESPPLYGVLVFGKPFWLYHRSGHLTQPSFEVRQREILWMVAKSNSHHKMNIWSKPERWLVFTLGNRTTPRVS